MDLFHDMTFVQSTGDKYKREALGMKKLEELNSDKVAIKKRAKQLLYLDMQKKASELRMQYKTSTGALAPVSNVKEISLSWCQDSSDENARIMFEITYGQFEKRSNLWRSHMEQDIMNEMNLAYREEEEPQKSGETGCISKLITAGITEIRKNLNRAGKEKHGRSIGIANMKGQGKKQKRRKMGEYMACFVKSTGGFTDSACEVKSSKGNGGKHHTSDDNFYSACQSDDTNDTEEDEVCLIKIESIEFFISFT